jgi:xanthine dehydrogenase accessory factor
MDNLRAILRADAICRADGTDRFLVTIVNTIGSTYRQPGARMLVTSTGEMTGMISGGCLEQDILCHIQQRQGDRSAFTITYDTTTDADIVWGLGIGCDGVVEVLVEAIDDRLIHFLETCLEQQQPGIIATIVATADPIQYPIGARLMQYPDRRIQTDITDSNLGQLITTDLALSQLPHQRKQYLNRNVTIAIEVITPPTPLIIFGAGRDAIPLAEFAKALGWHVTVVDCRALEASYDRFAMADRVSLTRRAIIDQAIALSPATVAVVMTHNYYDDQAILKYLLPTDVAYIGVLGSKQRTNRLLQELQADGCNIDHPQLHTPIGLDIGAETPEAIAIAIVSEIQAILTQRRGGFLKHRSGKIHWRLHQPKNQPHPKPVEVD